VEIFVQGLDLAGRRVLVTQSLDFMGPAVCATLRDLGAEVIADDSDLTQPGRPAAIIAAAGRIDGLILNLATPAPSAPAAEVDEDEWQRMFTVMVHPMQLLVKAALPQMIERRAGKIVLMGSASALKGMPNRSSYSAARGAQLAYIQAVGVEVARHSVQVNAIAQNFVENPTYFPPEVQSNPEFKERLKWQVPLGRLVHPKEDAMFAAYLCSDAANCFVGQVFPVCGGWVTR
jgi:NAD(P)-dependent dehydrogenase (short-subunit alcohol dehydrogenase family)